MLSFSLNLLIPLTVIVSCAIFVLIKLLFHLRLFRNFEKKCNNFYHTIHSITFYNFRKRFPITVNCWFCNFNTKVPYNNQNSFSCPACKQYNGFTTDGEYNRDIPEQHYSKLNASNSNYCQKADLRLTAHNGLCDACNRNQGI